MYAEVNYAIISSDSGLMLIESLGRATFIQENEFESVVCKMRVILCGTRCVNYHASASFLVKMKRLGTFW